VRAAAEHHFDVGRSTSNHTERLAPDWTSVLGEDCVAKVGQSAVDLPKRAIISAKATMDPQGLLNPGVLIDL
jgi:hypothetical protein